jgi:hypothetical protein
MSQIRAISTPATNASGEAEQRLRMQGDEVDQLRRRVTERQASGGKLDAVLLAEFARAQQAFLKAKIEHEHLRQIRLAEEEALAAAEAEARALEMLAMESSPAVNRGKPLLRRSRVFWMTIIVLLSCELLSDLLLRSLR